MFLVREIQPADLPRVYDFTISLLRHHGKQFRSYLNSDELGSLFLEGYLRGFLLVQTEDAQPTGYRENSVNDRTQLPVGCMIFHPDISPLHGGRGVLLDQFYIEPPFRRLGLGRKMMIELCHYVLSSDGAYIKLIYQDGLGLEPVYENMGFVNFSRQSPGIHLFEAYGKSRLEEFFERSSELSSQKLQKSSEAFRRHMMVIPLTRLVLEDKFPILAWFPISTSHPTPLKAASSGPPPARLVVVKEEPQNSVQSSSTIPPDYTASVGTRLCMFVEQCSVCSWLGPMVTFSDFVGDTALLDVHFLANRVQSWTEFSDKIRGATWEVSVQPTVNINEDSSHSTVSTHTPMASNLANLNVPDDTSRDGWNIAFLNEAGMRNLIDAQRPHDEQKCRID